MSFAVSKEFAPYSNKLNLKALLSDASKIHFYSKCTVSVCSLFDALLGYLKQKLDKFKGAKAIIFIEEPSSTFRTDRAHPGATPKMDGGSQVFTLL